MNNSSTRAGYVALMGRPNVGKSTLLNRLLAQKISITAHKAQTTRHAVVGIKTRPGAQLVYVDTPGLHVDARRAMNRYMNRTASRVLGYVDVVVFLVEALSWKDEDTNAVRRIANFDGPVILAISKVDRVEDKARLLPFLQSVAARRCFAEVVPISAVSGENLDALEERIASHLPSSEFLFPPDQVTTASQRFLAAELIREKLTRVLHEELPYALTVEIEKFAEEDHMIRIGAVIWVERPSQKGIVIGKGGTVLKEVGRRSREDMEKLFQCKVYVETWVRVRKGWTDDESALRGFGYCDEI